MSALRAVPSPTADQALQQTSLAKEASFPDDGAAPDKAPLYSGNLSEGTTSAASSAASAAADDEQGGSTPAASQQQQQQQQPSARMVLPSPSGLDGIKSKRRAVFSMHVNSTGTNASVGSDSDVDGCDSDGNNTNTNRSSGSSSDSSTGPFCLPPVHDLGMLPANCVKCLGSSLHLGLGARTALVGLSRSCVDSILVAFSDGLLNTHAAEGLAATRLHTGLRVAALLTENPAASTASTAAALPLCEQVAALAEKRPQLLCLEMVTLRRPGVSSMLKSFSGAVLVLSEGGPQSVQQAQDQDPWDLDISLLRAIGVSSRFVLSSARGAFEAPSPPLPALPPTEILPDLKLKDLEEDPDVKSLVDQAQPWYDHYFHDDLVEEVRCWAESRVAFLVCRHSGSDETLPKWKFLGLIIYKLWGPPLRSMSILRVVVPGEYRLQGYGRVLMRWVIEKARAMSRSICSRLTLCSLPEAIPFYERLQFTPIPQDDPEEAPPPDPELPQPMPGTLWMHLKCGRVTKPSGRR